MLHSDGMSDSLQYDNLTRYEWLIFSFNMVIEVLYQEFSHCVSGV